MSNKGVLISYDDFTHTITVFESSTSSNNEMLKIFSFVVNEYTDNSCEDIESTLGQLILYHLHKISANGLPLKKYESILSSLSEENFNSIFEIIDLANPDDQYDYATLLLSHGRRSKSWAMIEKAEYWFQKSANAGNAEAKRFIHEDLPVIMPRLIKKFKP